MLRIVVDPQLCRGSGECVKACPHQAISLEEEVAVIDTGRCDLDGICIPACPYGAITLAGEEP
jgi:heterodisulfide reductase subunit A-like polyferredoxin